MADTLTARLGVAQPAHLAEVDLQLITRLAVRDPQRDTAAAPAHVTDLLGVAVQGPLRDHHTLPGEQLTDLDHGQPVGAQPPLDAVVMSDQQPPRRTVAVAAVRPDRLHHRADEPVAELLFAAVTNQTQPLGGGHVAADRLAVHPRQPLRRPDPSPRSHSRSTSPTSNTPTSRNAIAAFLAC